MGIGIGLTSIDPLTDSQPFDGLATGRIIWWILSNLAALYVGGLEAARASGLTSATDGGIHGFLAWGLYLIISILLITSITGSIFSGMGTLVASVFEGDDSKEVVINLENAKKGIEQDSKTTIEGIKSEMFEIIETAEAYKVLPSDSEEKVRQALNKVENSTTKAIKQLNLKNAVSEFVNDLSVDLDENGDLDISVKGNKDYISEDKLTAYLTENTALTEEEIYGVISKWNTKIDEAIKALEQTYIEAKQEALRASEAISDNLRSSKHLSLFNITSRSPCSIFWWCNRSACFEC